MNIKLSYLLILILTIACSCNRDSNDDNHSGLPVLTTINVAAITNTTAVSGGSLSDAGTSSVTAKGIVWNTAPNPTTALVTRTTDGIGIGSFTSIISGLEANTTYYVRAYATNSSGTAYGNEINFTTAVNTSDNSVADIDGNVYPFIVIGDQSWMQRNLEVSHYRNGDEIPQVQDPDEWAALTSGAWCYYDNDSATGRIYGKLYNWYAVNDFRGLAPEGYHVPNEAEWSTLISYLGGEQVAGDKMQSTALWLSDQGGTNSSGFTALPAGNRNENGRFIQLGAIGIWWSSMAVDPLTARFCYIYYFENSSATIDVNKKFYGFSVRCLKT